MLHVVIGDLAPTIAIQGNMNTAHDYAQKMIFGVGHHILKIQDCMNLPNDSTKFSDSVVRRHGRESIILILSFINLPFQLILQPNFGNAEVPAFALLRRTGRNPEKSGQAEVHLLKMFV
jgi:hypothetical protein